MAQLTVRTDSAKLNAAFSNAALHECVSSGHTAHGCFRVFSLLFPDTRVVTKSVTSKRKGLKEVDSKPNSSPTSDNF